jgi:eukaryotic-like serine/threonine-protein kinase
MNVPPRALPQKLGKYEIRREVGRGGMGVVYEGFDPLINRRVALKTFLTEFYDGTQADNLLTRLRREAQAAGRLSHKNIIAVYDYGEEVTKNDAGVETSTAFIAMEFVEGRSLESYFEANERFPMREIERIMSELLDALEYSHSHGVVHRDIKPANIILLADGTVKVGDFGVARIESSTLTQVGTVLGSPSYMSPEQFMGQTVDGRSDLYSAGVVLYQLLTAEVPFTGAFTTIMHRVLNDSAPPPSALNVQVPKGFDTLLSRAMAKRPDERFQTAAEFKQAIAAAIAGAPLAGMAGASAPANRTMLRGAGPAAARGPRPAVLFIVLGVLIAGGAGAYYAWGPRLGLPMMGKAPSAANPATQGPDSSGADVPPGAAAPQGATASPGNASSAVISAVGVVNPADPSFAKDPAAAERMVWADARRQLVAKAAALYVQPSSLNANYGIVRAKLLTRSDDFITAVLQQPAPQVTADGLLVGTLRASVSVRDVQKSLNQISRDERVEFIRNNGNPRISVSVRAFTPDADTAAPSAAAAAAAVPQPSPVAENLLKEHIRSFGFTVVDDANAKPPADFHVDGEVRFKKLSLKSPEMHLNFDKFVITSWTVKAVDLKTGEEIYHNTAVPQKQSWATEELALQDVGQLIGAQFSQSFFLQYFDFKPKKARLRFSGLPAAVANVVLAAINGDLVVLNAALVPQSGSDVVIDAELSGGASDTVANIVQTTLLAPLNQKIGVPCFSIAGTDAAELHITFDPTCTSAATINRLQSAPQEALTGSPAAPADEPVKDAGPRKIKI